MATYTVKGFSGSDLVLEVADGSLAVGNQFMLNGSWDSETNARTFTFTDDDANLSGDNFNDEQGNDSSQSVVVTDAGGATLFSGRAYLEWAATFTAPDGTTINMYVVEVGGVVVGEIVDHPIVPGVTYQVSGVPDVTSGPAYSALSSMTYDRDAANSVQGGQYNDSLQSGAGNDTINAGADADYINAGDGDDTVYYGQGGASSTAGDTVYGGAGNDLIDDVGGTAGNVYNDQFYGEAGNDTVWAGGGNDSVDGGTENDNLYGEDGADTLRGGAGDDWVDGGGGNDSLFGDDGVDIVLGGDGNDTLYGGAGADMLSGGNGNDVVYGGADADRIYFNDGWGADTVYGDSLGNDQDTLDFSYLSSGVTVTFSDSEDGTATNGANTASFDNIEAILGSNDADSLNAGADASGVSLDGGAGNDTLTGGSGADTILGGDGADTVWGGAGNDSIEGGAGNDTLQGAAGDDTIWGGAGANQLMGGDGADLFLLSNTDGASSIYGGEGGTDFDTIDLSGTAATVVWTGFESGTITYDGGATYSYFWEIEAFRGTTGNDVYNAATAGSSVTIDADAGDDTITGSSQADTLTGGAGADVIDARAGNDSVSGGDGNDQIWGGAGNDTLDGGSGADTFWVNEAAEGDTIIGGEAGTDADVLSFEDATASGGVRVTYTANEQGTYLYNGTAGSGSFSQIEYVWLTASSDSLDGTAATTGLNVLGNGGADTITTGAGNDSVIAGDGTDVISGGAGNDTLYFGLGNDTVSGGDGNDLIDDRNGVLADVYASSLDGGAGDDTIFAGGGADTLIGGAGADSLSGEAGADQIAGGAGADTLLGGADADTISVASGDGADSIVGGETGTDADALTFTGSALSLTYSSAEAGNYSLDGGSATGSFSRIEQVYGTGGADTINASAATTGVDASGEAGNDSLTGGAGADYLSGGAGADTLSGNAGADTIEGGDDADLISGGDGDDRLYGDTGDDTLSGGAGADSLSGGDGADRLTGGAGNDTLTGGLGADTYVFDPAGGADRVVDFDLTPQGPLTTDQLDVSALTNAQGQPVNVWDVTLASDGAGGSLLTFPNGETVQLAGIDPSTINSAPMLHSMGIPCFVAGTLIDTPEGPRAVERLAVGDLVRTRAGPDLPVLWTSSRAVGAQELSRDARLRPIEIKAGALGNGRPLRLSPLHAVFMPEIARLAPPSGGKPSLLAAGAKTAGQKDRNFSANAHYLSDPRRAAQSPAAQGALLRVGALARTGWGGARELKGLRAVSYHHFMLPCHALVRAEGLWAESFWPGPAAFSMLTPPSRAALLRAYPNLSRALLGHVSVESVFGPRAAPLLPARRIDQRLCAKWSRLAQHVALFDGCVNETA